VAPADRRKKKTNIISTSIKLIYMTAIQILGLVAGTITSITFLPQVIKIWKTKSAKDLSLMMLLLLMLGVILWLIYGLLVMDAAIIYTNSMVLAMSLIMLYFKLRFK
jgi:MtN3 and saliva related transmembrane protein